MDREKVQNWLIMVFRARMTDTLEILGSRTDEWIRARSRMTESSFISTRMKDNRFFRQQLLKIQTQRDYINLINEVGTIYLLNVNQLEELGKMWQIPNFDVLKRIIEKTIEDLKRL